MEEQETRKTDDRDAGQNAKPPASRPRQKTSRLAIAAFSFGMGSHLFWVGFFAFPHRHSWINVLGSAAALLSMSGLVIGVIALVRTRKSGGGLGGRYLALAGIIAAVCFIGLGNQLPALGRPSCGNQVATRCRSNLRSIAQATQTWSLKHGDDGAYYPPSMRALYDDGVIEDTRVFTCPATGIWPTPDEIADHYECLLDIVGEKIPTRLVTDKSAVPLAWDNTADRHNGIIVVYFDQRVMWYRDDDALEQVHREVEEWLRTYEAAKQAEENPPQGR